MEREELLFCCRSVWTDFRSSMFLCRLCMHWVLRWGWSLHAEERISGAVCHPQKSWWFTERLAMISERSAVHRTKRTGPSTEPWGAPYMAGMVTKTNYWLDWYLFERYDWNHWSAADWMPKTEFRRERRIWWSLVSKLQKDPTKEEIQSGKNVIYNTTFATLFGCYMVGATWKEKKKLLSWRILCTLYNHAPCHITSCKATYAGRMRIYL